jgi:hypothetical protein
MNRCPLCDDPIPASWQLCDWCWDLVDRVFDLFELAMTHSGLPGDAQP